MNCDGFRDRMFAHVDGELRGDDAAAAAGHEHACPDCRDRADYERALEARIGAALLADAAAPDLAVHLRRARPAAAPAGRGRLVTLRRAVAAAAALVLAVQAAWFLCIPPFECAMLQAVEAATRSPAATDAASCPDRLTCLEPPAAIDGHRREGPAELVHVGHDGVGFALRARYAGGGESFSVLWCVPQGRAPSFRRHTTRAGAEWWLADENGHHVVAWMCPVTETMCTLVGAIPEERLIAVAAGLRGVGR